MPNNNTARETLRKINELDKRIKKYEREYQTLQLQVEKKTELIKSLQRKFNTLLTRLHQLNNQRGGEK